MLLPGSRGGPATSMEGQGLSGMLLDLSRSPGLLLRVLYHPGSPFFLPSVLTGFSHLSDTWISSYTVLGVAYIQLKEH